jgi:hypothetical protein
MVYQARSHGRGKSVTFQVALLGSDGFVVASDTKITDERCGVRTGSSGPKVFTFTNREAKISCACACSGAADLAFQAKDKLFIRLRTGESSLSASNVCSELLQIGDDIRKNSFGTSVAPGNSHACGSLLLALAESGKPTLWRLDITQAMPTCEQVYDKSAAATDARKRVVGDHLNSSVFFTEQYYEPNRLVDELVFLAAHTVLMAGRRNPENVNGLEIVKCKNGELSQLAEGEIRAFRHRSVELDDKIRGLLD